jgi:hypothetical protein
MASQLKSWLSGVSSLPEKRKVLVREVASVGHNVYCRADSALAAKTRMFARYQAVCVMRSNHRAKP